MDASLLSLLLYTYPVMVTVAAIALGRERASRRTAAALALAVGRARARAGRRRGRRARPARHRARRSARRSSTAPTSSSPTASPRASARSSSATLVCTGAAMHADARLGRARATCIPARERRRVRLARRASRWCPRWRRSACSSPACAASARPRPSILSTLEPVVDRRAGAASVFGESLGRASSSPAARSCCGGAGGPRAAARAASVAGRTGTGTRHRDPRADADPQDAGSAQDAMSPRRRDRHKGTTIPDRVATMQIETTHTSAADLQQELPPALRRALARRARGPERRPRLHDGPARRHQRARERIRRRRRDRDRDGYARSSAAGCAAGAAGASPSRSATAKRLGRHAARPSRPRRAATTRRSRSSRRAGSRKTRMRKTVDVDDPELRDAGLRVERGLDVSVRPQAAHRDLDHQERPSSGGAADLRPAPRPRCPAPAGTSGPARGSAPRPAPRRRLPPRRARAIAAVAP